MADVVLQQPLTERFGLGARPGSTIVQSIAFAPLTELRTSYLLHLQIGIGLAPRLTGGA